MLYRGKACFRKLLTAVLVIPASLSVSTGSLAADASLTEQAKQAPRTAPSNSPSAGSRTLSRENVGGKPSGDAKPATNPPSAPHARLTVSDASPVQGETIEVTLTTDPQNASEDSSGAEAKFNEQSLRLFPTATGHSYSTLLAIPAIIHPGRYKITAGGATREITVKKAGFPIQSIHLPKHKNNFKATPGEKEAIKKAKEALSGRRSWSGTFQKPVKKARISSRFGVRRKVNGKLLDDYFHAGMDFAAPRGTAIRACAAGKVILARTGWRLHGNTVCIDHGQGVISIYIHMNSIKVKQGEAVRAGEKIGTVGSTGRASGPHLHFGLYVNKVAANPVYWFKNTY